LKVPEIPPKVNDEDILKVADKIFRPELRDFVDRADRDYLHWDKLRHMPPAGITPETAWTVLKLSRRPFFVSLPLKDKHGTPFLYWVPTHAQPLLHEIDRHGDRLVTDSKTNSYNLESMRARAIFSSLIEEAIATSQIEGAVTTRQVAKQMLVSKRKPRNRSEQMIINSYQTMEFIKNNLDRPLTIDFLFDIQESITQNTLDEPTGAGRFRTREDNISVFDTSNGEVIFVPPPAEQLAERMRTFFDFVNAGSHDPFLHPLVKASIIHFWFAYEHPFIDGNGRTARALFYWYMLKQKYWLFEFLTISKSIIAAPSQYYRAFLYSETDDNDLTYFIMYQLKVTQNAMAKMREYLARQIEKQGQTGAVLRNLPNLNERQLATVEYALEHNDAIFTFLEYQRQHNVTYITARTDLLELLERGLLQETKMGRQRAFLPSHGLENLITKSKKPSKK
jgi:Fic family protein